MVKVMLASAVILVILVGWLYVEEIYRRFAKQHPELGPYRDKNGGCGGGDCACHTGSCRAKQ